MPEPCRNNKCNATASQDRAYGCGTHVCAAGRLHGGVGSAPRTVTSAMVEDRENSFFPHQIRPDEPSLLHWKTADEMLVNAASA